MRGWAVFDPKLGEPACVNARYRYTGMVGAGILETVPNRANAERFLRFLLSAEAQRYLTDRAYDYPLADSAAPNAALTPLDQIRRPDVEQTQLGDVRPTERLMREVGVIP